MEPIDDLLDVPGRVRYTGYRPHCLKRFAENRSRDPGSRFRWREGFSTGCDISDITYNPL